VYFFRALPRMPLRDISTSSNITQSLRSPALVSEAISRLESISTSRQSNSSESKSTDRRVSDGQHILRIMTNLFTHSRPKFGTDLDLKHVDDTTTHSSITHRRSVVYIVSNSDNAVADRMPATEYVFKADTPANVCGQNAAVAQRYGRLDHERVFRMLQAVFTGCESSPITMFSNTSLIRMLTLRL
jgi:WD repeat-containing protein 59